MRAIYYECDICGHIHPWEWDGDCRDNNNRFTCSEIEAKHRKTGYEVRTMDERVAADDGTSGQDRDSYSDDQDRDSYTVEADDSEAYPNQNNWKREGN